jgi:hypothetical protein
MFARLTSLETALSLQSENVFSAEFENAGQQGWILRHGAIERAAKSIYYQLHVV